MSAPQLLLFVQVLWSLQAGAPRDDAETQETVLWFRPVASGAINARALLDAVSVYTRDLRLKVTPVGDVRPPDGDADVARAVAVLDARGARLGFWCEERGAEHVVELTTVDRRGHIEARVIETTRADEPELYRAIALKLRAAVFAAVSGTEAPVESAAPSEPTPAAVAPAGARPGEDAERNRAALARRASATRSPPSPSRFFISLGYRFSAPIARAPMRHALQIEGAMVVAPHLDLSLETDLAARTQQVVSAQAVSVFGLPVRAGVRLVRRDPRLTLGVGPFLAAHLLWASATGPGCPCTTSFTVAGGAGAEIFVRYRLAGDLAGVLGLFGEVVLPTTHYSVLGMPVLELGDMLGGALALVFPAP